MQRKNEEKEDKFHIVIALYEKSAQAQRILYPCNSYTIFTRDVNYLIYFPLFLILMPELHKKCCFTLSSALQEKSLWRIYYFKVEVLF